MSRDSLFSIGSGARWSPYSSTIWFPQNWTMQFPTQQDVG